MEEEIITLKCFDCENTSCAYNNRWIHSDSDNGCTRRVLEDIAAQYYHYIDDVIPFIYLNTKPEYQRRMYKEIIDFLYNNIYNAPIGQIIRKTYKRL